MNKISAVYKIVNTVTGDFYVGSSKDVKRRWASHKEPSRWRRNPNSPLYRDMQKYGVDKFRFQILAPVMEEYLTQVEQEFIDMLKPTYNDFNAKGWNVERYKEHQKEYWKSERWKEYQKSEKRKETNRRFRKTNKFKEAQNNYNNQLCLYNGEELTLNALRIRFRRAGVEHPNVEAKKYLIEQ